MENPRVTLLSLVALVLALGFIGGTVAVAPHVTVLVATIAALTYIGGIVYFTVGR